MTPQPQKTFAAVRTAFETRTVLACSDTELEQFLVALSAEPISDPSVRAHAALMGATMRQMLRSRHIEALRPPRSLLARTALVLSLAAFLCSGALAYHFWFRESATTDSPRQAGEPAAHYSAAADEGDDSRTHLTVAELAHRAPTLRRGTMQAWWAGEQARQIQKLEAMAKRQALAGDFNGAARTTSRADAIRKGVTALADFERPPSR